MPTIPLSREEIAAAVADNRDDIEELYGDPVEVFIERHDSRAAEEGVQQVIPGFSHLLKPSVSVDHFKETAYVYNADL